MTKRITQQFVRSSGNVFADLGLADAPEFDAKVRLGVAINSILDKRRLTRLEASKTLDIDRAKISALMGYRLEDFTIDRLVRFLVTLGEEK
jgi:predicted XRE-type DNA-binding protein